MSKYPDHDLVVCGKCRLWKSRSEFYKNRRMSSGVSWECKVCYKDRRKTNGKRGSKALHNRPKVFLGIEHWLCTKCGEHFEAAAFDVQASNYRGFSTHCKACKERTRQARTGPEYGQRMAHVRDWRNRILNPYKRTFPSAMRRAIKLGLIVRPEICEDCGKPYSNLHGHHNSYDLDQIFVVRWLCTQCHADEHKRTPRWQVPASQRA